VKVLKSSLVGVAGIMLLAACNETATTQSGDTAIDIEATPSQSEQVSETENALSKLETILSNQSDEAKSRYDARNPADTITFFGLEPGMTVVEVLPGGGWYSKILLPYLGEDGTLVGGQYPDDIWIKFGFGDEWAANQIAEANGWPALAADWAGTESATIQSVKFTEIPASMDESVDAVLFIRALHNLNRFETDGAYLSKTISETMRMLKPGGVVGVVQHSLQEDAAPEGATGARGYLKPSFVIEAFEGAGFELVKKSDINSNPKDVPSDSDIVWRLPPTNFGTDEDTPERAAMEAIGESSRMTLLFRKPT